MKIFILEDDAERIKSFKKIKGINNELFIYDNINEVKRAYLEKGPFDFYYFDHDLDNRTFVPSNEPNTGYQVAKWIVENDKTILSKPVIIHSMNYEGAQNIKSVIPNASYVPFHILLSSWKKI